MLTEMMIYDNLNKKEMFFMLFLHMGGIFPLSAGALAPSKA